MCSKEIKYYQSVADDKLFKWFDIANKPEHLISINIPQKDALLYLHASDENNKLFVGVDAFLLIWKNIKYWKFLYFFVSIQVIKQLAILLYKKFAKYRFSKLSHCQLSLYKKN